LFPIRLRDLRANFEFHDAPQGRFPIGPFTVEADEVIHPGATLGYRVSENGRSLAYLSDHEPALAADGNRGPEWISGMGLARDADILIHDAQYTQAEREERLLRHDEVGTVAREVEEVRDEVRRGKAARGLRGRDDELLLALFHRAQERLDVGDGRRRPGVAERVERRGGDRLVRGSRRGAEERQEGRRLRRRARLKVDLRGLLEQRPGPGAIRGGEGLRELPLHLLAGREQVVRGGDRDEPRDREKPTHRA